jgi:hypothetical protein
VLAGDHTGDVAQAIDDPVGGAARPDAAGRRQECGRIPVRIAPPAGVRRSGLQEPELAEPGPEGGGGTAELRRQRLEVGALAEAPGQLCLLVG